LTSEIVPYTPLNWGVPPCCVDALPSDCPVLADLGLENPQLWYLGCVLVQAAYASDVAHFTEALTLAFNNVPTTAVGPGGLALTPRWLAGWDTHQVVVVVGGSISDFQVMLQALGTTIPPTGSGRFGANAVMLSMAIRVATQLVDAGVPTDRPILFFGHSLGGFVASWLTLIEDFLRPGRRANAITFGEPRGFDSRARSIANGRIARLCLEGDPVPYLPPHVSNFAFLLPLVGVQLLETWERHQHCAAGRQIDDNGQVTPWDENSGPGFEIYTIIVAFLAGGAGTFGDRHTIVNYTSAIQQAAQSMLPQLPPCSFTVEEIEEIEEELDPMVPGENQVRRATTMDIYRTTTAPPAAPAVAAVPILLEADFHIRGESSEGDVAAGHYTHTCLVQSPFTDVRDDYNEGTRGANYDVVWIPDQNGSALVVRFVEIVQFEGSATLFQRVYLDRRLPTWPATDV